MRVGSLFAGPCPESRMQGAAHGERSLRGRSLFARGRGTEVPSVPRPRFLTACRPSQVAGPGLQGPRRRDVMDRNERVLIEGPVCGPLGITFLPSRKTPPPSIHLQKTLAAWVRAPSARAKMGLAAAVCAILGGGAPPPYFCALSLTSRALYHIRGCCNIFRDRGSLLPPEQSLGDHAPGHGRVAA